MNESSSGGKSHHCDKCQSLRGKLAYVTAERVSMKRARISCYKAFNHCSSIEKKEDDSKLFSGDGITCKGHVCTKELRPLCFHRFLAILCLTKPLLPKRVLLRPSWFFFKSKAGHVFQWSRSNETWFHLVVGKKLGLLLGSFLEGRGFDWRSKAICKLVITWKTLVARATLF